MAAQIFFTPMPTFTGLDGQPMTGGYVYFGEPSQDPRQYPASVYFDQALTIEASQPVRTNAGYLYRNGAPTQVWLDGPVSVLVLDPAGRQVYYAAQWTDIAALLPVLAGNGGKAVQINAGGTAMEAAGVSLPTSGTIVTRQANETISGNKTFDGTITINGPVAGTVVPTLAGNNSFSGVNLFTGGSTFGYGTGAGGTVVQATSKSTAVTLNKPSGMIQLASSSIAGGATERFTLNNTEIDTTDVVIAHRKTGSSAEAYEVWVDSVASGSCQICVRNRTGGAIAQSFDINFVVIEGVHS